MENNDNKIADDWWLSLCTAAEVKDKPYYSIQETAQLISCSKSTVLRYSRDGWLESKTLGPRKRLITAESIKRLYQDEPVEGNEDAREHQ